MKVKLSKIKYLKTEAMSSAAQVYFFSSAFSFKQRNKTKNKL